MAQQLSRREFLQAAGLALGGLSIKPPPLDGLGSFGLGRVAAAWINLYDEPSFRSRRLAEIGRDELVSLQARETSDEGPQYNPVWFRVPDGYVHSGDLQLVRWLPQTPLELLPEGGALFEVSVPYTRSYVEADPTAPPLYRLYFESTAWVEGVAQGADGRAWYRILDDLLRVRYFVRAEHLRCIPPDELTPIAPEVPLRDKRIEVSLARQELLAYEAGRLVLRTRISSGIPSNGPTINGIPTTTPSGRFYINLKTPLRHMGNGRLTSDLEAYELPGVPWVSFFHATGVAFHGTYWHTDFGRPRSHGCVNMRTEEAKWLYRWTMPVVEPTQISRSGHGTMVDVA
ncbi:MAG: hypothetical protein A2Y93_07245 [Chloroflexi bacterium RBG_13_68_17]|nr:MAG: hypothetical protein A2Y93_07245 [Chloroflexi bacterium RBG_13_68_17]